MRFELKNYKTMQTEELNAYLTELTNEFEKTKVKIKEQCQWLEELDEEFLDVKEELNKREPNG